MGNDYVVLLSYLPSIATLLTAFGTIILAIVTWKSVKEIRRQNDSFQTQTKILQNNMERDKLIKKIEALRDEMDSLVGPLYNSKTDISIFRDHLIDNKIKLRPTNQKYAIFWPYIENNLHKSRSEDLSKSLHDYLNCMHQYENMPDPKWPGESGLENKRAFESNVRGYKDQLIRQIERRYSTLVGEIEGIERQLEIL